MLDRFPLWLEAIEAVLTNAGFGAVQSTRSPDEAIRLLEEHRPDIHVSGFDRVEGSEVDHVRRARARAENANILVLASDTNPSHIELALRAGAYAYVLKTAEASDLAAAVRQAFEQTMHFPEIATQPPTLDVSSATDVTSALTPRELQILELAAEGHSNAQLARQLQVSEQTIKFHMSNIYRKLHISNRTEASRWAQAHGLLPSVA